MLNKDELLIVVDENNIPLEPKPRHIVHSQGLWHRVTQIWIYNSQNQLLCQKRSLKKDAAPGCWEPFFGGHMNVGDDYITGASKELAEELGLNVDSKKLKFVYIYKKEQSKEFQGVFVYHWDGNPTDLIFEKEEIDELKWFTISDFKKIILNPDNPTWSLAGNEDHILPYILEQ